MEVCPEKKDTDLHGSNPRKSVSSVKSAFLFSAPLATGCARGADELYTRGQFLYGFTLDGHAVEIGGTQRGMDAIILGQDVLNLEAQRLA